MRRDGQREFDLVVFGATGYTGALTAEYLARYAPAGLRWAVAGRDAGKLAALRDRLGVDLPLVTADVADPASLRRLAEAATVVASTVGPYLRHGEPLVAACAETGTDYADLTGEPEFVDLMYLRHHATAERTGARLVHACGFDSVPHDLGAHFTVGYLPADQPISVRGYVRGSGRISGGTFDSAVAAFARSRQAAAVHRARMRQQPRDPGRRVRAERPRPGYDRVAGAWVLPLPTIDPQIVVASARSLPRYGPDFRYAHLAAFPGPFRPLAATGAVGVAVAMAQFGPTRALLRHARPAGPTPQQREAGWFRVRFIGVAGDNGRGPRAGSGAASGARVVTEVSGGDPGYGATSTMLAESALCLALDDLPTTAGQVTTAVAMGDTLRARLERAGITFRRLDTD